MSLPKIAVSSISFSKQKILRSELSAIFPDVRFNEDGRRMSEEELISFSRGCGGVLVGLEPVTKHVIDSLPDVRIFAKYGVGLDNVDVPYLESSGRTLGWQPGVNRRSVSELALMFMLALTHNVHRTSAEMRSGIWNKDGGRLLSGRVVGIVGCGFVGEDLLELLRPFGITCLIHDILEKPALVARGLARQVNYEELLRSSDIVSFHVPLTPQTRGMLGEREISMMRPGALVVNTSRGPVVDQAALKRALILSHSGQAGATLAAAALDVFEIEPVTDTEFLTLPNLLATPHVGGNALEAVLAMGRSAIEQLCRYFGVLEP